MNSQLLGKWVNEYDSQMVIESVSEHTFTGIYSSTTGETGHYNITGCFNPVANPEGSLMVSIGISWNSTDKGAPNDTSWDQSISSMTGQIQQVGDKLVFTAMHLLASPTNKADNWRSSYVDKLTFVKQPS